MTKQEIETKRIKSAADKIIHDWLYGRIATKVEAHLKLNRLNGLVFDMYDFDLTRVDPGETQEYIHGLLEKYNIIEHV